SPTRSSTSTRARSSPSSSRAPSSHARGAATHAPRVAPLRGRLVPTLRGTRASRGFPPAARSDGLAHPRASHARVPVRDRAHAPAGRDAREARRLALAARAGELPRGAPARERVRVPHGLARRGVAERAARRALHALLPSLPASRPSLRAAHQPRAERRLPLAGNGVW